MPIGFVGPALQGANFIGRFGIPLLQQAGIAAGMAGIGAGVSALTNRPKAKPQQVKPRQAPFTSLSSDQLPAGAYMTEAGRTYGIDSEQVGRLGGYMDERGRIFLPANNQVSPSSWGASSFGRTQPPAPGLPPSVGARTSSLSTADRAYEAEKSRVAQLTAQDPELQRYESARKTAVTPGATPEQVQSAEDIGMQIWRQKYGNTPIGQPGGAVGTKNPLMDTMFGYQAGMSPQQMQAMQATASPVQVAPGEIPYQQGDLSRATLETGYDPAQYGLSPNLIEEMKERLMKQARK